MPQLETGGRARRPVDSGLALLRAVIASCQEQPYGLRVIDELIRRSTTSLKRGRADLRSYL